MHHCIYVSLLVCLLMALAGSHAADPAAPSESLMLKNYNLDVLALEKEWTSTHNASYFCKARDLLRSAGENTNEYQISKLDLASGVLLKSRCGIEFRSDERRYVLFGQAEVIENLARTDIRHLKDLSDWPELRARYVRIMMYQRAAWISLQDPSLDGKVIELNSTLPMQLVPESDAKVIAAEQDRMERNQRVSLQIDLKRFLNDNSLVIDRFMVAAFSIEPIDLRMLNESLAMGLYTPEERIKIVNTVEAATGKKLPLGQLPDKIAVSPSKDSQPAPAVPKADGEKKP